MPTPDDLPITPEIEAWRDAEAPGLDLPRAIKKFLLYARTKGKTNVDWTAAFCFYTMNGRDQQAALIQERQAAAAVRAAWQAERQAAAQVEPPGGADAWTDVHALGDDFYGTHVGGCGYPHQFNASCPT